MMDATVAKWTIKTAVKPQQPDERTLNSFMPGKSGRIFDNKNEYRLISTGKIELLMRFFINAHSCIFICNVF